MRITCVTVDCRDPLRVAEFWNEALTWDRVADDGEVAVCRSPEGGIFLEFVRVPEAKKSGWSISELRLPGTARC